jgi:hypothetical protein
VFSICFIALSCSVADGEADDGKATPQNARQILAQLKAECDVPGQSHGCLWMSYVSATEKARHECISQLRQIGQVAIPEIHNQFANATAAYKEMLVLALAAIEDSSAVLQAADLMLNSQRPSVRVCAAWELRGRHDQMIAEYFKKALRDEYKRKDGSCLQTGDGMIYPVRMIASDALVELESRAQ